MQAFPVIRSSDLSSLPGPALFIPRCQYLLIRTQLTLTKKLFFCSAKFGVAPANLLVAEKEEAKAVLTLFLKKRGLSKGESLQLLRSRMLCVHTLKASMRSSDILGDAMENFPNPLFEGRSIENLSVSPVKEALVVPVSSPFTTPNSKKLGALARLTDNSPTGELPPLIICLTELGIDYELIKEVTSKFPTFANYCLDGKVKLVVEFLLDLGVPKSDFPAILRKSPQVFGASLSERVIPNLVFLEKLGVDRKQWPKVIYRHPPLLTYSLQKMKSNLDCLYELGLSKEKLGKVLMYSPNILGTRVEKLRATAQYFHSIGADVGTLLHKSPQLFGLSVEANLKPVTLFFLEKGFSMEEVAFMVSRYGCLYCFSLSKNIMPKWEFFLTMGYPKSDLVKFPHYFGYSLELRIKPRYAIMMESGVVLKLPMLLNYTHDKLDKRLKRIKEKNVG